MIAEQSALGVAGLLWGLSHEHLARVALHAGDSTAYSEAARVAATAYRVNDNSMLTGRYRRLLEDAERSGVLEVAGDIGSGASGDQTQLQTEASITRLFTQATVGDPEQLAYEALTLLRGNDDLSDGWMYLLTDSGLRLSASSRPPTEPEALLAFAQAQLELELDDGSLTMTAGQMTCTEGVVTLGPEGAVGPAGQYRGVPLRAQHDGVHYVVGIVVISSRNSETRDLVALASQLAAHLIESGAYRPMEAA